MIELVVVIAMIGLLAAFLLPAVQAPRESECAQARCCYSQGGRLRNCLLLTRVLSMVALLRLGNMFL
jgi:hypothetical protein